jgi:hypothetical protein
LAAEAFFVTRAIPVTIDERVIALKPEDLEWSLQGSEGPHFYTRPRKAYKRSVSVDPFPAYAHSRDMVAEIAAQVEASFPVPYPPDYYLLPFEVTSRVNGWASHEDVWDKVTGKSTEWEPHIILSGKRIPVHPAMTRYLVAHEYGHVVDLVVGKKRGLTEDQFDQEYIKLRPGSSVNYGGGRWHQNVGELIANDFRIVITGIEDEFWPHEGFSHPRDTPKVREFWNQARAECAA